MNNFKLTQFKTSENIHRRIFAKSKSYSRSVLYPLNENGKYELLDSVIQLEEGEIPIYEYYSVQSYLLITTRQLISKIRVNIEDSFYENSYCVPIENLIYAGELMDIINERNERLHYQEEIIKHIDTINGESIEVIVKTGIDENLLHEILTQLVWMCDKYRST